MTERSTRIELMGAPLPKALRAGCSTATIVATPSHGTSRARSLVAASTFPPARCAREGGLT